MKAIMALKALPSDPLLGLMDAFHQDQRSTKIDLGIGVYKNSNGVTPVMQAVRLAEIRLCTNQKTKVYEGPRGNAAFCQSIERLVFQDDLKEAQPRLTSMATPGGCGAIYLAMQIAKRASKSPVVWISDPSWPNHNHVAHSAGLKTAAYRYLNRTGAEVAFDAMMDDLKDVVRGDLVVLQGPCHNPSGLDMDCDQWRTVAKLANKIGFIPLIDIAYHGLGSGLQEDIKGVQEALRQMPEAIITYSCSKNFGLYRERTGCLLLLARTREFALSSATHLADISRASYSMPPAHGAAVVEIILNDPGLTQIWVDELANMRERIRSLRISLADTLVELLQENALKRIALGNGMFSLLPIAPTIANQFAKSHGIYMPSSGRINIAGLKADTVMQLAEAICSRGTLYPLA